MKHVHSQAWPSSLNQYKLYLTASSTDPSPPSNLPVDDNTPSPDHSLQLYCPILHQSVRSGSAQICC